MASWIVRLEFRRTTSILAVSRVRNAAMAVTWRSVETAAGANLVATRRLADTTSTRVLSEAARTVRWIQATNGSVGEPTAISVRPEDAPQQVPDLVTLAEIGKLLGVSRQRAQQLSRQPDFPRPLAKTGSGPLYALSDAENYYRVRQFRKGRDHPGDSPPDAGRQPGEEQI
ncbi:hypothetical protein [Micromonospora robiginosa]|uniref:Helix-turn-helix domain-containing protein n=1 Tax=Micromonospora robiginosa TaxID=2749844 RepID=A0A7L6B8S9_9ACTN|nr:hypothetical protein [Micromonospora ferruginea]QLQ38382.1 hypothetical protein H1D33_05825 [Micromonospora ferruginea]